MIQRAACSLRLLNIQQLRSVKTASAIFQSASNDPKSSADIADKPFTLSPAHQMYASKFNEKNKEDFEKKQKTKKHYRLVGIGLTLFVLSVYGYTMFAVSQEKFLDDFDIPEPPVCLLK